MIDENVQKAILTLASLITGLALFGIVGTMDYEDAKAAECQGKGQIYDRKADQCRGRE